MPDTSSGSARVFYRPYSRSQLVELLGQELSSLAAALPLRRVVLFGSWVKGRSTAFSDVDLLVVYADPPRDDAYALVRRHLQVRGLEPHVYSESQAASLGQVIERMTRGGISLM